MGLQGLLPLCALLLAAWSGRFRPLRRRESIEDLPNVLDARVSTTPERARLIVDLSGPSKFAIVSLDGPDRIAIDVQAFDIKILAPADVAGKGIVSGFTVEMADTGRARTILTLAQPAQVQQAYVLDAVADQPARLVVDLIPDTADSFKARVAADLAASQAMQGAAAVTQPTDPAHTVAGDRGAAAGGDRPGPWRHRQWRERARTASTKRTSRSPSRCDLQKVLIDSGQASTWR